IESRPNYGMRASGTEMNMRFCLCQYVFDRRAHKSEPSSDYFDRGEIRAIHELSSEALDDNHLVIKVIAITHHIIQIVISLHRIRGSHSVDEQNTALNTLTNHREHMIAKQIVESCESSFRVVFPAYETIYISLHLSGTKIISQADGDVEKDYDRELQ